MEVKVEGNEFARLEEIVTERTNTVSTTVDETGRQNVINISCEDLVEKPAPKTHLFNYFESVVFTFKKFKDVWYLYIIGACVIVLVILFAIAQNAKAEFEPYMPQIRSQIVIVEGRKCIQWSINNRGDQSDGLILLEESK